MAIKFINSQPVLHLIDTVSRLSAACRVPNKKPPTILKTILECWSSVYGSVSQLISDRGGEFINPELIALDESCGITIQITPAYSPWSNGIVERHNKVLGEMVDKIVADTGYNFEIARHKSYTTCSSLQKGGCYLQVQYHSYRKCSTLSILRLALCIVKLRFDSQILLWEQ